MQNQKKEGVNLVSKKQSKLLREARLALGVAQADLARELGYNSNGQFIYNIESGRAHIPAKIANHLCETLSINPKELVEAHVEDIRNQYVEKMKES